MHKIIREGFNLFLSKMVANPHFFKVPFDIVFCVLKPKELGADEVGTAYVCFDNRTKITSLVYTTRFIHLVQETFKGDLKKQYEFMLLVTLHETLHINLGHLVFSEKKLKKLFPTVSQEIINVACDFEVNLIIKKHKGIINVSPDVWENFEELVAFPPEEWINETNDGVGNVFFWIKKLLVDAEMYIEEVYINQHSGIGSMENVEDMWYANPTGNPIDRIAEEERRQAGVGTRDVRRCVPTLFDPIPLPFEEIYSFYESIVCKYGERESYAIPHKLNTMRVLPDNVILPTLSRKFKIDLLLFVDVSGSMSPDKLSKIYKIIGSLLDELGDPEYVAVDTKIKNRGIVQDESFVQYLEGGGGTDFKESVNQLVDEGYAHFLFYTDGQFNQFNFPPNINPEEQLWVLVEKYEKFHMPGKVVYV